MQLIGGVKPAETKELSSVSTAKTGRFNRKTAMGTTLTHQRGKAFEHPLSLTTDLDSFEIDIIYPAVCFALSSGLFLRHSRDM